MCCSGVLKATASGGRPMSPTVTTEAGVPGESSARVPVPAEEAFGPATASATTLCALQTCLHQLMNESNCSVIPSSLSLQACVWRS